MSVSNRSEQNIESRVTAVHNDAFSSGQVGSKLWLCEKLGEVPSGKRSQSKGQTIWIYGGWEGVLGFMLLSRPEFREATVRSFDIDPTCAAVANTICENWVWREWQFRAFTKNCNELEPAIGEFGPMPTIVINTSVEHFDQRGWFEKIPRGTVVVLQASDFEHDGAVSLFNSEEKLSEAFPLSEVLFSGKLGFKYDTWGFNRFMLIGCK